MPPRRKIWLLAFTATLAAHDEVQQHGLVFEE